MNTRSILEPGRTAWRLAHARRVAFLVDGESYYRAVAYALATAQHSVFILGWDVHSKISLLRGDDGDGLPRCLGSRLARILSRNRGLEVYVLDWDYPIFFAQERESRVGLFTRWPSSRRFHMHYDACHPVGASHHQKIIVVDDCIAFGGGMDIGLGRWDSCEHLPEDSRRRDPGFGQYVPNHDVMVMADHEVARALGELARERWTRATGEKVQAPLETGRDCWPHAVHADITNVEVAISRTRPAHEGEPGIFEIEALYAAAIASTRNWIYIENQYLTSDVVVDALTARLREEGGPDIVIALPQNNFGWFEARTIQVLHFECIRRLRRADVHGRLRVCYPKIPNLGDKQVNLHSKVFVIDDQLLRIGSSNATNRSMRLDTECDFSIEANGDGRLAAAISELRNRLLGEHLGLSAAEVAGILEETNSLTALVDSRSGNARCLCSVEPEDQPTADIGNGMLIDPKGPLTAEVVIETFAQQDVRRHAKPRLARVILLLGVFAALAAGWQWTPIRDWLDPDALAALGAQWQGTRAPFLVLAVYLVGALVALPVTVLILATASVFGPWLGIVYSVAGSLASAMLMFWVGRGIGRGAVESLTGRQYRRIADGLRDRGVSTMVVLRLLPIAPFTIVNMVVGVTGVPAREFALGTVLGMLPGIVSLSVFQAQLLQAVREPGAGSILLLGLIAVTLVAVLGWLRSHLRVHRQAGAS